MDAAVLSAVSALIGSVVGLSASAVTSWMSQRTLARRHAIEADIKKREALYAELFGLREKNNIRQSVFRYFHGRSSLTTWL